MENITITKIDAMAIPRASLEDVIDDCYKLALTNKCIVYFKFNDVQMRVSPTCDKQKIIDMYFGKIKELQDVWRSLNE